MAGRCCETPRSLIRHAGSHSIPGLGPGISSQVRRDLRRRDVSSVETERCGNALAIGSKTFPRESGEVKAVQVHHLVPGSHEVAHERLLRVVTGICFCEGPELG